MLESAFRNKLFLALNSGFVYYEKDINIYDKSNNSPLYYAAKNGNLEFCKFLLENNADPNASCNNGLTPMHMALKGGNIEVNKNFFFISNKKYFDDHKTFNFILNKFF